MFLYQCGASLNSLSLGPAALGGGEEEGKQKLETTSLKTYSNCRHKSMGANEAIRSLLNDSLIRVINHGGKKKEEEKDQPNRGKSAVARGPRSRSRPEKHRHLQ